MYELDMTLIGLRLTVDYTWLQPPFKVRNGNDSLFDARPHGHI